MSSNRPDAAEGYYHRLEAFSRVDAERNAMVAELITNYNTLSRQYEQKCIDYEDAVESRRSWQSKATTAVQKLTDIQRVQESNQFVYVAIDGDGAYFLDELVQEGEKGGEEAARRLLLGITNHLEEVYPQHNVADWSIIVQVYLAQSGLARALFDRGIIKNPYELPAFAHAFGNARSLFSFIDVGSGKERADHKIKEMMRVMLRVNQCRHVMMGPCLDNGYLPFLSEYKGQPFAAGRITLIEMTPSTPGFHALGFRMTSMPNVFRSQPLPDKSVNSLPVRPASTSTDGAAVPTPSGSSVSPPSDHTAASWAALGKNGLPSKTINVAPKKPAPPRFYLVNKHGERLDEELPRWDPNAEKRFSKRIKETGNMCNNYQLRGRCPDGEFCPYDHGERLGPAELLVLRHKARSLKCQNGPWCDDPQCFYGHHCRFGKGCTNPSCRFADTHHIDLTPAKKIYDDGRVEVFN